MARSALLGVCFACGVILGILGTVLHGNIWVIGEAGSGLFLPWGAALALLILLLAVLWAGTTSGRLAEPALLGGSAFTVATVAYLWPGPDQLVVPFSPAALESVPGPVIASLVWWFGSAVITAAGLIAGKWVVLADVAGQRRHAGTTAPAGR
ncbi:hypothetical protein [Nesterenkonia sp.]|uniref:hypothetical protein n=1 Tax=Nesterenkonia sp. TaxID=704201 RepID=UPI002605DB5A|nr:hypothetical protein [Nesterenkonia sp.]